MPEQSSPDKSDEQVREYAYAQMRAAFKKRLFSFWAICAFGVVGSLTAGLISEVASRKRFWGPDMLVAIGCASTLVAACVLIRIMFWIRQKSFPEYLVGPHRLPEKAVKYLEEDFMKGPRPRGILRRKGVTEGKP